jgi:hypothetical protein
MFTNYSATVHTVLYKTVQLKANKQTNICVHFLSARYKGEQQATDNSVSLDNLMGQHLFLNEQASILLLGRRGEARRGRGNSHKLATPPTFT